MRFDAKYRHRRQSLLYGIAARSRPPRTPNTARCRSPIRPSASSTASRPRACFWNPPPVLTVASESLGIIGDQIDAVNDLGIQQRRLKELRFVLRPGRKHKLRISYLPITYQAETNVSRSFVFNGQRYAVNLPVSTDFSWKTWLFGYEYDSCRRTAGSSGCWPS